MPIILNKYNIAYFDTPKSASTSIKAALYKIEHDGIDFPDDAVEVKIHWTYPTQPLSRRFCFAHLENHWKFCVIRDPISRLLSAYSNRIIFHSETRKGKLADLRARLLNIPMRPDPDIFFENLDRYWLQSGAIRHHIRPATDYLGHTLKKFDSVYPIEELSRLETNLCERSGRAIELKHYQTGGEKIKLSDLSHKARVKLIRWSRRDYNLLKGHYKAPSEMASV